jgi:hypothetical protein
MRNIPSTTVRQALLKFIEMDQVETLGEGKATKYRVKINRFLN